MNVRFSTEMAVLVGLTGVMLTGKQAACLLIEFLWKLIVYNPVVVAMLNHLLSLSIIINYL